MGKGESTRTAILEQAVSVAAVLGLDGLSIGGLAKLTGLSKSGLFGHFGSKEALQHSVLAYVVEGFIREVIAPSLKQPTGVKRLQALFEHWLDWSSTDDWAGGCPLTAASFELDDQPGPLRAYLVEQQAGWLNSVARMAQRAIADGEFRAKLDVDQFAFDFQGIGLGYIFASRLLDDVKARDRATASFKSLIKSARANP